MKTTTKVILGITVAAAAGAAIGILLAPEKGKDIQKKIADGVKEWAAEFASLLALGKDVAAEVSKQGQSYLPTSVSELNKVNENS